MIGTDCYDYMERVEKSKYNRMQQAYRNKRRKLIIYALIIATVAMMSLIVTKSIVFAGSDTATCSNKSYNSVVIHCMDTVESIAEYYATESVSSDAIAKEICSINHIDMNTSLIPGNNIIVPNYDNNTVKITITVSNI